MTLTGLGWILKYHKEDLEFLCEHYNKSGGSRVYTMNFFHQISEWEMRVLWEMGMEAKEAATRARKEREAAILDEPDI